MAVPNLGLQSYMIIGEQSDWATPLTVTNNFVKRIYEIESTSLKRITEPITPERQTRFRSPIKNVQGMISCGGDLTFHLHASDLLVWFKHLMSDASVTTNQNSQQEVRADAAYTEGVGFTLDSEPNAVLVDNNSDAIPAGKLEFNFTSASGTGTIVIQGTDQNGESITETISASSPTQETSTLYYATVTDITINTITATSLQIDADPVSYTHDIAMETGLLNGLTGELVKGDLPNTYHGLLVQSGTITLADIITISLTLLGRDGSLRKNVADGTSPSSLSGFSRIEQELAPNWGMAFDLNGTVYPVSDCSISIDNNIDFPNTRFAESNKFPKPVPKGRRDITIAATINYDSTVEFDNEAYGTVVTSKFRAVSKPYGGRYSKVQFDLAQAELVGFPDPDVADSGELTQALTVRGYGSSSGNDEATLRLVSAESGIPT